MNFFKRATTSLTRRPGKAVILLLLLFVLGNIISGAVAIRQAVSNTEANLRSTLPPVATISWDHEAANIAWNRGEEVEWTRITSDMIREIGALPHVEAYDFSVFSRLMSRELFRTVPVINPDDLPDWIQSEEDLEQNMWTLRSQGLEIEEFSLRGVSNENLIDVQAGLISIAGGRTFTQAELDSGAPVALISRDFADRNGLTVGSIMPMENNVYDTREMNEAGRWDQEEAYSDDNLVLNEAIGLEVIGIFENEGEFDFTDQNMWWQNFQSAVDIVNRIYIPNTLGESISLTAMEYDAMIWEWGDDMDLEENLQFTAVFALDHPRYLSDFVEQGSEMLPSFHNVADLSGQFNSITASMDQMQWIANLVLTVAVGATIIILSLLITLFLRDRKQEIGIYLALGEKKGKVVSQILFEVMSVAVVAITISLFTGNLLSQGMSRQMLQSDLQARQEENWMMGGWNNDIPHELLAFTGGTMTVEDMVAAYDTSMDFNTILIFYGVGVATLVISTVSPILYITRLDPKKIMM